MRVKLQSHTGATFLTFLLLNVFFAQALYSQYLVSSQSLGVMSTTQLETQLGVPVRTGVALYKLLYVTTDVHGMPDTASGLLVFPDEPIKATLPMVIYQHGTTNGPDDVPSRLASGMLESIAYGSMGYVTIAADYIGLGDSGGFHPYLHAASEASAGLDMLFAGTEWIETMTNEPWLGEIFVSGYSQGGHAAAALQRELEKNWSLIYPVKAATLMSGPYSMSGIMYDLIVGDQTYYLPAYIPYVVLSYQEAYGNIYQDLSDIFKPEYLPNIEKFANHTITTTDLNFFLILQLSQSGAVQPKRMFTDSTLQDIISNENDPLRVALRDNDVYDWTPQAPTRLYYCTEDEQVPYQNSLFADSVMQARGAQDVATENFGALTHRDCATPAITASIAFFDSFILPAATHENGSVLAENFVYPNPATDYLEISPKFQGKIDDLTITDLYGRTLLTQRYSISNEISLGGISPGIYLVRARKGDTYLEQKLLILD